VIQILVMTSGAIAIQYGTGNAPCADHEVAGPVPAAVRRYPTARSFAEAVRQSIQAVPHGIGNKANKADCHELVAAVYLEQEDKQRRTNSFVISGLTAGESPDNQMVENLCRDELGLSVEVVSCKRVGRQDLDKPCKLLV
jgi:hypothetical protein